MTPDADAQTRTDEAVAMLRNALNVHAARLDEGWQHHDGIAHLNGPQGAMGEVRGAHLRTVLDVLADTRERVAELEDLGTDAYADKLVNEMRLRSLEIRNGGFEMDITEAGDLATAYVAMARTMLGDAENYSETPFEFHVKIAEEPQKYILTVQRTGMGKLTPHEARQRAEAECDRLRARMRATSQAVEQRARAEDATGIAPVYCAWWDASALVDETLGLGATEAAAEPADEAQPPRGGASP